MIYRDFFNVIVVMNVVGNILSVLYVMKGRIVIRFVVDFVLKIRIIIVMIMIMMMMLRMKKRKIIIINWIWVMLMIIKMKMVPQEFMFEVVFADYIKNKNDVIFFFFDNINIIIVVIIVVNYFCT